ncbi:MAG: apolipoprotein N-acyltransferase [Azoarcus sp.]|jgi:apolipoprotein N-acyltransferase|nr:apolipoprotein N-acyltransferase [Azoarcus sp.]
MKNVRCALFATIAGALAVAAFAPLEAFPLAFVSLAWLAALLERAQSARAGFGIGFAWGLGAFGAGVSWLYVALERYGGMPPLLAAFAIFLFCAYLSLYPALAGAFYARWRAGGVLQRALLFAAAWLLTEWLRGVLFTGFPWLSIAYTQTPPSPLAGYFALIGVYGVGALVAFVAGLGAFCASACARKTAVLFVLPAALVFAVGWSLSRHAWVEPDGEPLAVSLAQPNIEQSLKWDPASFAETLRINADLVHAARGDVVVLPETALTALDWLPEGYLDMLGGIVGERGGVLLTGAFVRETDQYRNSAIVLGAGGERYAKRHLVPFGEYSPPFFGWFYRLANIPMSQQVPGEREQAPFLLHGRRIAVNICYEDVFGAELIDSLPQAGLMLNISNLAWYGDSFAQPQHLQIARVRAMESGRPMLRSTNTGMTALALPDGSVPAALPAFTRGVLETSVSAYRGDTPYARLGDAPALAGASIVLGALALMRWRRCFAFRRSHPDSGCKCP